MLAQAKERVVNDETLRNAGRVAEVEAQLATMGSFVFDLEIIKRYFGDPMANWVVQSPLYKEIVHQTRLVALQEGRLELLVHQLQGRFGELGDELLAQLQRLTAEHLTALADAVFSLQSRDELTLWLARATGAEASTQTGQNGEQQHNGQE